MVVVKEMKKTPSLSLFSKTLPLFLKHYSLHGESLEPYQSLMGPNLKMGLRKERKTSPDQQELVVVGHSILNFQGSKRGGVREKDK
ncbi:hypothetical protein NC653_012990 [Populus alba x Populus x berolinensis]|uniref:Uncharacterized protein n=1 Tax=Populus alba x Populus x berolinensis TaxID=444605 RepID=A0AAD6QTQ9_9ROSI|nr:hypothetical protein NC653_012990 [Populus alba x Populus x berolinensis]